MCCKIATAKDFSKITEKLLHQSLFFSNFADLSLKVYSVKVSIATVFFVNFQKLFNQAFLKTPPNGCTEQFFQVVFITSLRVIELHCTTAMCEKCPYSEIFWFECRKTQSRKNYQYTLFTQCQTRQNIHMKPYHICSAKKDVQLLKKKLHKIPRKNPPKVFREAFHFVEHLREVALNVKHLILYEGGTRQK